MYLVFDSEYVIAGAEISSPILESKHSQTASVWNSCTRNPNAL